MTNHLNPPKSAFVGRTPDGEVTGWMASPIVAIHQIRGCFSTQLSEFVREFFDEVFATVNQPLHVFGEYSGVTSYETKMREIMTQYAHLHRDMIADLNYLISNKMVAFGITVFGLGVTGTPIHSYLSAKAFDDAIQRAIDTRSDLIRP